MPSGKKAVLKLPFAYTIKIVSWDKPELQFDANVRAGDEATKQRHTFSARESSSELVIETNLAKEKNGKNNSCWSDECDSLLNTGGVARQWNQDCKCFRVDYEIHMPAGTALVLETINGDVELRGLNGPVRAKSINGFVDMDLSANAAGAVHFSSVNGEIYTDFDLDLDKNSTAFNKKVKAPLNGGGQELALETINGDIFFRKRK